MSDVVQLEGEGASIALSGDGSTIQLILREGGGGGGASLSNATPADLGTAAPGVSTEASRADHVHDLPSAADVGAASASHVHSGADITSGTVATARLGSGTANATTFLRGDQTWAAVNPKVYEAPRVVGAYYTMTGGPASAYLGGGNATVGAMVMIPVWIHAGTLDRIGVTTTAAGNMTWRLGIYPADPTTGLPDGQTVFLDAGVIDFSVTPGIVEIAISKAVATSGLFWLASLCVTYVSNATAWGFGSISPTLSNIVGQPTNPLYGAERSTCAVRATGLATGSLPATCPATTWLSIAPKLMVRYA